MDYYPPVAKKENEKNSLLEFEESSRKRIDISFKIDNSLVDILEEILKRGEGDINARNERGETLLTQVCESGQYRNIELLLKYKADVNQTSYTSDTQEALTPIQHVILNCCEVNIVELLLKNGANPNDRFASGSILEYCIGSDKYEIVSILLLYGADKSRFTYYDETKRRIGMRKILPFVEVPDSPYEKIPKEFRKEMKVRIRSIEQIYFNYSGGKKE